MEAWRHRREVTGEVGQKQLTENAVLQLKEFRSYPEVTGEPLNTVPREQTRAAWAIEQKSSAYLLVFPLIIILDSTH